MMLRCPAIAAAATSSSNGPVNWREEEEKDEDILRLKRIVDVQLTVDEKKETSVM